MRNMVEGARATLGGETRARGDVAPAGQAGCARPQPLRAVPSPAARFRISFAISGSVAQARAGGGRVTWASPSARLKRLAPHLWSGLARRDPFWHAVDARGEDFTPYRREGSASPTVDQGGDSVAYPRRN